MVSQDARAVAELRGRVFRFILKTVRIRSEAEDLTQRTILLALENISSYRHESSLSTWVIGIAFNLLRNHRKTTIGNQRFVSDTVLDTIASESLMVDEAYEQKDEMQRLQHAIDGLPAEFREALILVCLEDMSYDQTASILQVPIGTVRSRIFRARQLLRASLDGN